MFPTIGGSKRRLGMGDGDAVRVEKMEIPVSLRCVNGEVRVLNDDRRLIPPTLAIISRDRTS